MTDDFKTIVIGASAGGVEGILRLTAGLPKDINAAILIVIHTSPKAQSLLPRLISKKGPLPAAYPESGEILQKGRIYIAPPDYHMVVKGAKVLLNRGPRENLCRPAVDPLFRSVASVYGKRTIGIILSGSLDDGTAGLAAIKKVGGICIVQDPEEAIFNGMPKSALEHVDVDHVLSVADMPAVLTQYCSTGLEHGDEPVTEKIEEEIDHFGNDASSFICPECGGALWEIADDVPIFKCRIGHALTSSSLLAAQDQNIDKALWSAVRALEERAELSARLASKLADKSHRGRAAKNYREQAERAREDAESIKKLLLTRIDYNDPQDV